MLESLIAASRFLHYACLTVLFGILVFPLYAAPVADTPSEWRWRIGQAAVPALAGSVVSGVLWFLLTTAGMSGDLNAAGDPSALWTTLTQTPFGPLWSGRLLLALLLLAAMARPIRPLARFAPAVLSGLLLASLALTGHTQGQEGLQRLAHEAADALHLLAAGAWLGGLVMLAFVVRQALSPARSSIAPLLARFSRMGYGAVAILVASGVVNGVYLIDRPRDLIATGYGRLLCVKMALFLAMVAFAAVNRFRISPALAEGHPDRALWLTRLSRNILLEQGLGAAVLAAAAVLGVIQPGPP